MATNTGYLTGERLGAVRSMPGQARRATGLMSVSRCADLPGRPRYNTAVLILAKGAPWPTASGPDGKGEDVFSSPFVGEP
jgi:hypothetical protein